MSDQLIAGSLEAETAKFFNKTLLDSDVSDVQANTKSSDWPEPQPMTAKIEPEPYPIDALPDTIQAAVREVAGFVKAPLPLVASSAIAAVSLACQAYVDVKRAERLHSPAGVFFLTIADSGERKSTCDNFFTSAIRQYQDEQAEAMKPAIEKYEAEIAAWHAERDGLESAIKEARKKGKPTNDLKNELTQLHQERPESPRIPRLLYADVTPEALAYGLAKHWPSAGILSSEGGVVLGGHGMSKDSLMKNLSMLNQLWDGSSLDIDRRTSESFTVRGARLTIGLQIQEKTLRAFFDKSGDLARGTGFLARFLVAWPESTQGTRLFTEAPANWPSLAAFHQKIAAILNEPAIDESGALTPITLELASDAKKAWIEFHDGIEEQLSSSGLLYEVRDVAAKTADNAARLAALFHIFEGGTHAISLDAFERASAVMAWHLNESRRFFGEIALPAKIADSVRLNDWLIQHCKHGKTYCVAKRYAHQYGTVRDTARLDAAIAELAELDRIQIRTDGKKKLIWLNPAILPQENA